MDNFVKILFIFLTTVKIINSAKLTSEFRKCTYGREDFNECVSQNLVYIPSILSKPMKSVNLPSLEPLDIKSFSIAAGSGPVQVQQNFRNGKMTGYGNVKTSDVLFSLEPDNLVFDYTAFFPYLKIVADYKLDGKVLMLPIKGEGRVTIELRNLTAVGHLPMEKYAKKGETYIRLVPSGQLKLPKLGLLSTNFENLFNGDKTLGDSVNTVLNENWEPIFDDVRSGYEKAFSNIVKRVIDGFFSKVPVHEMVDNSLNKLKI